MNKAERDTFLYYRHRVGKALDVPPEDRTKGLIKALQSTVYGCCDYYLDWPPCGCMKEAEED